MVSFCAASVYAQVPTIASFSPASGQVTSLVTITGTNFNATAANNLVYFGNRKALVSSATTSSIVVQVPAGAPNEKIYVTVGGKTCVSPNTFKLTVGVPTAINSTTFLSPAYYTLTSSTEDHRLATGDFDNDGKHEVVCGAISGTGVYIARNTSVPGTISFAATQLIANIPQSVNANVADFDGDGSQDLLISNGTTQTSVLRNTSTTGSISFTSALVLSHSNKSYALGTADLNNDGLTDIVVGNYSNNTITCFLNSSSGPGFISFASPFSFTTPFSPWDIHVNDFDGDGMQDVAVLAYSSSVACILRNLTSTGSSTVSFASPVSLSGQNISGYSTVRSKDINGDNRPDIVIGSENSTISVFQNNSTPGTLSFNTAFNITLPSGTGTSVDIEDINGDGFNDVIAMSGTSASVMQSTGSTGTINSSTFQSAVTLSGTSNTLLFGKVIDVDNDGRKDLLGNYQGTNQYAIRRYNLVCPSPAVTTQPVSVASCAGSGATFTVQAAATGTVTYQWRKNGVNISGATQPSYTISSVIAADSGNYSVAISDSCVVNHSASTTISLDAKLIISGGPFISSQPTDASACGGAVSLRPVVYTNNGTTTYQWTKNGSPLAGATQPVLSLNSTSIADTGLYQLNITNSCGSVSSSAARITYTAIPVPVAANGTTCSPTSSVFLSNPATVPSSHITRWYDDAAFTVLLASGPSFSKVYSGQDTVYARNEYNTAILSGVYSVDHNAYSGDDNSAIAATKKYYYYVGDLGTVRCDMPGLTNPVVYTKRDAIVSTYGGTGALYSLGTSTGIWGTFSTATPATHIWQVDSVLNPIAGTGVALSIGAISTQTGSFLAGGPDFILYKSGSVIFKINPATGLVTTLSSNLTNFVPFPSESAWAAWGFAEEIGGNHYITYHSNSVYTNGITRYYVEGNSNLPVFDPGSTAVVGDLAAIANAPWYGRWYFKHEGAIASTASTGMLEPSSYCDAPMRFNTAVCNSAVDTVVINSTIPVVTRNPAPLSACAGGPAMFTVASTGANLTYVWRKNGINITNSNNDTLIFNNVSYTDTADYTVSINNTCINVLSASAKLSITGVNITTQPVNTRNCAGEPVSLSVVATGRGTMTYQWKKNTVNVSGANSATLNIASLTPADAGSYTVAVTDSCNIPVLSAAASLSISTGPLVTSISPNTTACINNTVSLNVVASGNGNLTYQWRRNGTGITGANAATYTINSFATSDAGTYSVAINDNCGQAISGNISLSQQVIAAPVVIDRTFCSATTSLTHTNSASVPGGYITRWYDDDSLKTIIGTGTSISKFYGGTDTIYARNEPTSSVLSGAYSVEHDPYTGDDRGGIAVTQNYYYYVGDGNTVRFRMPGLTNPTSLTMRDGIIATYGGAGALYSLGTSTAPWGTNASNATHIWALDSNLNAVTGSGVALNGVITNLVTNGGMMVSGEDYILYQNASSGFIYKINPSTGAVTVAATTSFNLNRYTSESWASWGFAEKSGANHYITYRSGDGNLSKFHVEGNTSQVIFTETPYSLSDMACISYAPWYGRLYFHHEGSTPLTASSFNETAGYCDAPMRFANTGCYSAVDTIFIIAGSPVINLQPQSQVNCAGTLARFVVRTSGSGTLTYQWRKSGVNISGATDDTLTIALTSVADTGDYAVVITNTCGSITSNTARLTVKGVAITTQPVNIRNCMGEPVSLTVAATGTGTLSYQWRKNGINVSGATAATYNMTALSPLDTGTYTVRVTDSCNIPVTSASVYVSISTGPSMSNVSPSTTVCRGSSITLSATVSGNGTITHQWRKNGSAVSGANSGSYAITNFSASDTGNYVLVSNDNCGQTISSTINVSLLIVAAPEVNNNSVCTAGNSVSLTNTVATPSGYTTKWYDDAAMTVLLGSGPLLVRTINAPDTFYVRNENASVTCVSATDTVYVTITSSNTWTGASNTNWFNATNWSCGVVPNASSNAVIPAGTVNSPVINTGLTANVNALNIASGATVSMLGVSVINIYGTLTRTGTLSCPAGTVVYASTTTAITIAGGEYYNLSVAANSNGATLTGSVKLYNTFSFAGNTLVKLDTCILTQYNYTAAAVTGAGVSAYFVTNKTGRLRLAGVGAGASAGTSAFAYVGNSTYNPFGITNSGTIDTFTVRVTDSVTTSYSGLTPTGTKITSNVINRSWALSEETAGGSTLTLLPGWTVANETSSFNRSNCYVARYAGSVAGWTSNTAGVAAQNGSIYLRSQPGIISTGIFGVGSNGALPVELISFTALKQNNHVLVNWATASEINNNYFNVEVSADGQSFVTLDKVKGNGSSNLINQYRYLHTGAAEFAASNNTNTLYYRLTQVDFDGSEYETEIVPVSFVKTSYQVSVSPNPFIDHAVLSFSADVTTDASITLTDVNGKQISRFNHKINGTNGNQVKLEGCETLSAGVYFVRVVTASGEVNTFKLVKQ
ncbi:MAG: immunoglobulin domain-containing protein [Bacteroidota bacterium]